MERISRQKRTRDTVKAWALLAPSLIFMATFTFYPFVKTFVLSFYKKKLSTPTAVFNGIENYVRAFRDPGFARSVENTLVFCAVVIPASLILGLLFACLLNRKTPGRTAFRAMIFYPNISPMVGFYLVWMYLLASEIGYINRIFELIGLPTHNWLGEGKWAMFSIIIVSLWKNMGMLVILFMAGLAGIPNDIVESAKIDGANSLQITFRIILPNLKESYIICGLWAIIQSVKVFEQPFVMTNGGPGTSTLVLYQYTWQNAFKYYEMGYASAIAYFIGAVILVLSAVNMFLNREKNVDEVKKKKVRKKGAAA